MAQRKQFRAIKGTRDILPPESALWNRVEQAAREVFAAYGYGEIRLPVFEQTELFAHSVGATTDIVSKEMYSFLDSPVSSTSEPAAATLSLRPEATASVCRAYIEHGMHTWPGNVKLYYIGPMFRRERPQKGRYRQFYQIGAEVLGTADDPAMDAEVVEMLMAFFERIGLAGCTLHINSIGCSNCRPAYVEALRAALAKVKDKLGADSQRRIATNPLRVLDSKLPEEQAVIGKLPRIADYLCAACRKHFAAFQKQLELRGIAYEENWRLVRGLDYYTRTTFEITAPGLGAQDAVCGGGRYDGLVELLGGPPNIKGIGFAIGTDRVILSLQETGRAETEFALDVFIAWAGSAAQQVAIRLARGLRGAGLSVEVPPAETKFRRALDLANRLNARQVVLIGPEELAAGQFTVKQLASGEQVKLVEADLLAHLQKARRRG